MHHQVSITMPNRPAAKHPAGGSAGTAALAGRPLLTAVLQDRRRGGSAESQIDSYIDVDMISVNNMNVKTCRFRQIAATAQNSHKH
jgi:hypothetical protein